MRLLLKPLQWIYCIYALLTFVAIMLVIFPLVLLASLFGRIRGGNIIWKLCMLWGDLWFLLIFFRTKNIYEAAHDKSKPYIFVSNHISYLDAAFLVKVFRQRVRPLGKAELAKVPVFGFIYRKAIVTVDRTCSRNRSQSIKILKSIIQKGISVVVFPEGTFNMGRRVLKEFYDGAFRVAIETKTPVKPILFLDTYDRMNYKSIFSLTPGKCRAVFLDEISVEGLSIDDTRSLKEKVYSVMEEKLNEYGVKWISVSSQSV